MFSVPLLLQNVAQTFQMCAHKKDNLLQKQTIEDANTIFFLTIDFQTWNKPRHNLIVTWSTDIQDTDEYSTSDYTTSWVILWFDSQQVKDFSLPKMPRLASGPTHSPYLMGNGGFFPRIKQPKNEVEQFTSIKCQG